MFLGPGRPIWELSILSSLTLTIGEVSLLLLHTGGDTRLYSDGDRLGSSRLSSTVIIGEEQKKKRERTSLVARVPSNTDLTSISDKDWSTFGGFHQTRVACTRCFACLWRACLSRPDTRLARTLLHFHLNQSFKPAHRIYLSLEFSLLLHFF